MHLLLRGVGIRIVVHGDDFLSESSGKNLWEMDAQMRKTFSLKTEVLDGDPEDVQSIKVLNRQIYWKNGEIHWEADLRHVEILAKHLGLEGASTVKTPGDKAHTKPPSAQRRRTRPAHRESHDVPTGTQRCIF